jgi:hypothetical protein
MQIKITPNDRGNPPGKLADAEIHFDEQPRHGFVTDASLIQHLRDVGEPTAAQRLQELSQATVPLAGLKLIGFGIWERRGGIGRNVTFPARQYSVNGERRSFALLRPVGDTTAQDRIREAILEAYAAHEESDVTVAIPMRTDGGF